MSTTNTIRDAPPAVMALVRLWLVATKTTTVISVTRPALRATTEAGKPTPPHLVATPRAEALRHRIATTHALAPIAVVPTTTGMVPRRVEPAAKAAPRIGRHVRVPVSTTQRPVPAPTVRTARVVPIVHRVRTKVEPTITKAGVPTQRTRPHGSQPLRTTHGVRLHLPLPTTAIQAGEVAP